MPVKTAESGAGGPLADCTAFQIDLLLDISEKGPQHGLAIKANLEARYDEPVNHGRLYPNLDQLVEAGVVSKSQRDRRTNEYALTDAGEATLAAYRDYVLRCVGGGV